MNQKDKKESGGDFKMTEKENDAGLDEGREKKTSIQKKGGKGRGMRQHYGKGRESERRRRMKQKTIDIGSKTRRKEKDGDKMEE